MQFTIGVLTGMAMMLAALSIRERPTIDLVLICLTIFVTGYCVATVMEHMRRHYVY